MFFIFQLTFIAEESKSCPLEEVCPVEKVLVEANGALEMLPLIFP